MDPVTLSAILAALQAVPSLIAAAQQIRGLAGETDQAKIDAALDAAKAACLGDIAKAEADLADAAKA